MRNQHDACEKCQRTWTVLDASEKGLSDDGKQQNGKEQKDDGEEELPKRALEAETRLSFKDEHINTRFNKKWRGNVTCR